MHNNVLRLCLLYNQNSAPLLYVLSGYLSCCRFIDDNQIITSSGDTTWWVTKIQHRRASANVFSWANLASRPSTSVHCGTSRRVSRPQFSPATLGTSWACRCRLTSALLCQEHVTPRSNCGTSGTACVGRPSRAMSPTSMPSVWVCAVFLKEELREQTNGVPIVRPEPVAPNFCSVCENNWWSKITQIIFCIYFAEEKNPRGENKFYLGKKNRKNMPLTLIHAWMCWQHGVDSYNQRPVCFWLRNCTEDTVENEKPPIYSEIWACKAYVGKTESGK